MNHADQPLSPARMTSAARSRDSRHNAAVQRLALSDCFSESEGQDAEDPRSCPSPDPNACHPTLWIRRQLACILAPGVPSSQMHLLQCEGADARTGVLGSGMRLIDMTHAIAGADCEVRVQGCIQHEAFGGLALVRRTSGFLTR